MQTVNQDRINEKMRDVSAVAMLAIVITHSIAIMTFPGAARWNVWIQALVSRSLTCSWAVPFFFLISGYWCHRKLSEGSIKSFYTKKIKSLFVPYVLWCILGLLLMMPLVVVNNIVTERPLLSRTVFAHVCDIMELGRGGGYNCPNI